MGHSDLLHDTLTPPHAPRLLTNVRGALEYSIACKGEQATRGEDGEE